jgi:hypothetical protein
VLTRDVAELQRLIAHPVLPPNGERVAGPDDRHFPLLEQGLRVNTYTDGDRNRLCRAGIVSHAYGVRMAQNPTDVDRHRGARITMLALPRVAEPVPNLCPVWLKRDGGYWWRVEALRTTLDLPEWYAHEQRSFGYAYASGVFRLLGPEELLTDLRDKLLCGKDVHVGDAVADALTMLLAGDRTGEGFAR